MLPDGNTGEPLETASADVDCPTENELLAYVERRGAVDIRAKLEAHLDVCNACLALVCEMARSSGPELATTVPASDGPDRASGERSLAKNSLVDRYRIVRMIGQGGMGSVYEAYDPQLDRKVALKLVRTGRMGDAALRARLAREARTMAKLSHPNVVTIFDAGDFESDFFLAMELVVGETLARWLVHGERSYDEILRVITAAGRGLSAAHAAGIVHRDFKPENVLVDGTGRVLVTDFGLAVPPPKAPPEELAHEPVVSSKVGVTHDGALVGTPRYMSPEQYAGTKIDARSDQWSFAVVLYEALYRQRPFEGKTVEELSRAVSSGSVRLPPEGDRKVPPPVREALLRALSAAPSNRFDSLDAMLGALSPAPPRSAKGRGRTASVVAGAALALGVVAAGAVAFSRSARPRTDAAVAALPSAKTPPAGPVDGPLEGPPQVLILGFENRTADPVFEGTLDLVLDSALTRAPTLYPLSASSARTLVSQVVPLAAEDDAHLVRAMEERTRRPVFVVRGAIAPDGPGYRISAHAIGGARVESVLDVTLRADGPLAVVPTVARLACQLREHLAAAPCDGGVDQSGLTPSVVAAHEYAIGRGLGTSAKYEEALAALDRALAVDPAFPLAWYSRSTNLYNLGRRTEAQAATKLALENGDRLSARQRLGIEAMDHIVNDEFDKAAASWNTLLRDFPGDGRGRTNLAIAYAMAGNMDEALTACRRAVSEGARLPVTRTNLPMLLLVSGDVAGARAETKTLLADFPNLPPLAYVLTAVLAVLQGHDGDTAEPYAKLSQADARAGSLAKADLAMYEGRLSDAIATLRTATSAGDAGPKGKLALEPAWAMLAEALLDAGDRAGARAALAHVKGSEDPVTLVRAGRVLSLGGYDADAQAVRTSLAAAPGQRAGLFANVVETDRLRSRKPDVHALDALVMAGRGSGSWLAHADLGAAYVEAGSFDAALRQLTYCEEQIGAGAMAFYDDAPTLRYLPAFRFYLARAKEGLGRTDAADAYRAFLASRVDATDRMTVEARRRWQALDRAR